MWTCRSRPAWWGRAWLNEAPGRCDRHHVVGVAGAGSLCASLTYCAGGPAQASDDSMARLAAQADRPFLKFAAGIQESASVALEVESPRRPGSRSDRTSISSDNRVFSSMDTDVAEGVPNQLSVSPKSIGHVRAHGVTVVMWAGRVVCPAGLPISRQPPNTVIRHPIPPSPEPDDAAAPIGTHRHPHGDHAGLGSVVPPARSTPARPSALGSGPPGRRPVP